MPFCAGQPLEPSCVSTLKEKVLQVPTDFFSLLLHSFANTCNHMTMVHPAKSGNTRQWNDTQRGRAASLPSAGCFARLFSICAVSGEDSATLSLSKQSAVSLLHDKHSVCENMHHSFDCAGKFFRLQESQKCCGNWWRGWTFPAASAVICGRPQC